MVDQPSTNGHVEQKLVGQRDIGVSHGPPLQGMGNPAKEVFSASDDPMVYLVRARLNGAQIARGKRLFSKTNRYTVGHSWRSKVYAFGAVATIGEDGRARDEYVAVATADAQRLRARDAENRGMLGYLNRSKDINKDPAS